MTLFSRYTNLWQQLPTRDRVTVQLLILFLAATLFWALIYNPQHRMLQKAEHQFQEALQLQTDLLKLPLFTAYNTPPTPHNLASLVTYSTAEASLIIERMDSEESGRLNVNLGGPLDGLLKWLDDVENQGVNLVSLQLEVTQDAMARARLSIER